MSMKHPISLGFMWTFLVSLSLLFILILVVNFTGIPETAIQSVTYAIHILGVIVGSMKAGFSAGKKGWYYGGLTALSYILFIFVTGSLLFSDVTFNVTALTQSIITLLIGVIGGIIGVNFSDS
ncbi:hypothetical protein BHU72_08625 [Desulfuribacillus stibiiarsenatis]|uniref:TIGR04086 family membrane protein n=1 Tax=Desulfuribacillus stibiiarsenatis TaxID=1390249 RepID=A0A1E5L366_9FIRM|nr:TIGR04086 family membrane protein [Desulfuribacillus stibiiarsenatis]OEH84562.1 hypothetical protein BHU72_08625 [Desulfuribacillus stibiiarsenatis]